MGAKRLSALHGSDSLKMADLPSQNFSQLKSPGSDGFKGHDCSAVSASKMLKARHPSQAAHAHIASRVKEDRLVTGSEMAWLRSVAPSDQCSAMASKSDGEHDCLM